MDLSQIALLTLVFLVFGITALIITSERRRASVALFVVIINAALTTFPSVLALMGNEVTGYFSIMHFTDNIIEIKIDSLSAWFILIINFTTINGVLFGRGYLKIYNHLKTNIAFHWIFYILFHISMIWVTMFGHGIMFLIAWELMSLSSLMLVIFEYQNRKTIKAGLNYMIQMHISVLFLTIGFVWIYFETGSLSLSALQNVNIGDHSIWIFTLFFIGFAIKAGFIPFHTWLPHAHPAAPSHVSGVMSGVIVKLGIYGIFRIVSYINRDWMLIGEIILSISVITAIYGIVNSALCYDFKKSLAYCTIENVGIIGIGIGIGLIGIGSHKDILVFLGFAGALLHTLNHSLFKSLLFFSAGSVYLQTHTRNIEKLGGLIKSMPITALFFLIGALAISGLPPFNGFVSEYLIYSGLFNGLINIKGISHILLIVLSIAGLALVGGGSIFTFTKLFGIIFLGQPRSKLENEAKETPFLMLLPLFFIVIVMISVAIFPQIYIGVVYKIIGSLFIGSFSLNLPLMENISETIGTIGKVSLSFISLLILIFGIRSFLVSKHNIVSSETWGCGYPAAITKAQYTGKSFTQSFGTLFSFIAAEQRSNDRIPITSLYPEKRKFSTYCFDLLERYLVIPVTKRISLGLNYFQFIQNGKIQSYVIYGLFFIILVFIGTALGLIK